MAYFLKTNKRTGWNKRTGAKCPKLLRSSIFLYTKKMWVFFSFSWSFSPFDLKKLEFLLKPCKLHRKTRLNRLFSPTLPAHATSIRLLSSAQEPARFCKILQDSASFCKILQDSARFCKILRDSAMLELL